jgi:hypothetical protein
VSSHVGAAAAAPSPPEGLDKRQERYWLIERRCKDLCLYLDVLTRNMPRYEKYVLSAKMREIGYLCLELAIAANKKQHKKTDLTRFNVQHEFLRQLLNLAVEAKFIEPRRHWRTYKLIRKRSLKRLKRKAAGGCSLETTMAYLSHAKDTASLRHVKQVLWRCNPEHRPEIYAWVCRHRPGR